MKSNVANTTNRPDGLMTRLKDGVRKPLRTVILSGAALLAPDLAENVLPYSGGDPYGLHAAEKPQETESNSVELARVDNTTKKNEAVESDLDIYDTKAWGSFKAALDGNQKYLIEIMQREIAEAKERDRSNKEIVEVIEYGLRKNLPENVVFAVGLMSAGFTGHPRPIELNDFKKFFDKFAHIESLDQYETTESGRDKVMKDIVDYAYNPKRGLVCSKLSDQVLELQHREGDEAYRVKIMSAIYNRFIKNGEKQAEEIYLKK